MQCNKTNKWQSCATCHKRLLAQSARAVSLKNASSFFFLEESLKNKMLKIAELRDVSQLACSEIRAASFVDCADSWWLFKKNCVRY
jgi:hypothetical protein